MEEVEHPSCTEEQFRRCEDRTNSYFLTLIGKRSRPLGYPNSGATEERKPPTGLEQELGTDFSKASYPKLAEEKEKTSLF